MEDVLDDFELEALHNEGNTPIVKNIDLNKPHAEEEVTDEGKFILYFFNFLIIPRCTSKCSNN